MVRPTVTRRMPAGPAGVGRILLVSSELPPPQPTLEDGLLDAVTRWAAPRSRQSRGRPPPTPAGSSGARRPRALGGSQPRAAVGWRTHGLPPKSIRREQVDLGVADAGLRDADESLRPPGLPTRRPCSARNLIHAARPRRRRARQRQPPDLWARRRPTRPRRAFRGERPPRRTASSSPAPARAARRRSACSWCCGRTPRPPAAGAGKRSQQVRRWLERRGRRAVRPRPAQPPQRSPADRSCSSRSLPFSSRSLRQPW